MPKLKVSASRDGFRRAGRAWPAAGEVIDTKDYTPAQIAALKAEPMLEVSAVAEKSTESAAEAAPKGKK